MGTTLKVIPPLVLVFLLTFGLVSAPVVEVKTDLLYFGATWCPPCKEMKRLFKDADVKSELDKYDFKMYDYDEDTELAEYYGVEYLPTMVFERDEEEIDRQVGGREKYDLLKILRKNLN